MEDGYYWLTLKYEKPQIVEICGDSMLTCGDDRSYYLEDGVWQDSWNPIDIVSLIGPITPPNA